MTLSLLLGTKGSRSGERILLPGYHVIGIHKKTRKHKKNANKPGKKPEQITRDGKKNARRATGKKTLRITKRELSSRRKKKARKRKKMRISITAAATMGTVSQTIIVPHVRTAPPTVPVSPVAGVNRIGPTGTFSPYITQSAVFDDEFID